MTLIRIISGDARGRTPLGVDGRFVDLPHEREVPVDAAQFHALANSNIAFEIVGAVGQAAAAFDAAAFLDRPIRAIAPDLPALGEARVAELAAAESASARPRVTLLARLNRRAAPVPNRGDI